MLVCLAAVSIDCRRSVTTPSSSAESVEVVDHDNSIDIETLPACYADWCNAVLAESPKATTDKLQWVLNAAARVVTETWKYDRGLTDILRNELCKNSPQRTSLAQRATGSR